MEDRPSTTINFDTEKRPFVLPAEDAPLNAWPCAHWTLDEWAEQLGEVRFKFRVHPRNSCQRPDVHWENEAVSYVDATVAHLLAHVRPGGRGDGTERQEDGRDTAGTSAAAAATSATSADANPFAAFPLEQYCFYSGYNYMHELSQCALLDAVRWRDTAGGLLLEEEEVKNDGRKSTLWLGTSGAYTPAHIDTYGYNFVAQLQGRKRWILFPPADTAHLYPVRIPFEESSVFSQVNFKCIDLLQFPLLRHCTPHVLELKAGEVLFVPRHWWHFVENVDENDDGQESGGDQMHQQTVSISINMWVTGDGHENSLSEGLVQFLARPLLEAYGDASWLNLGADLLSAPEAGRILKALINIKQNGNVESDEMPEKEAKRPRTFLNRRLLSPCKLEDIGEQAENTSNDGHLSQHEKQIDLKDIVNCILDPEVIDLIKSKLRRCAKAAASPQQ